MCHLLQFLQRKQSNKRGAPLAAKALLKGTEGSPHAVLHQKWTLPTLILCWSYLTMAHGFCSLAGGAWQIGQAVHHFPPQGPSLYVLLFLHPRYCTEIVNIKKKKKNASRWIQLANKMLIVASSSGKGPLPSLKEGEAFFCAPIFLFTAASEYTHPCALATSLWIIASHYKEETSASVSAFLVKFFAAFLLQKPSC